MQKSTIAICLIFALLKTQAQDYLISFTGAGDTTVVSTVTVDNLTSGATVTLNGGDILHLLPNVGISNPDFDNGNLKIFPNPMTEESMVTFVASESGNSVISIVDLSGRVVCQISKALFPGAHSFRVSGIIQGIYFVKVTSKDHSYSAKLISQRSLQNEPCIEFVSSDKSTASCWSKRIAGTIEMKYTDGDQLLYKGITGQYSTIVPDIPVSSKTVTFNFARCTDEDGNNYSTVQIGVGKSTAQTWMAENLNAGVRIDGTQEQTNNGIIEKYCNNNDESNCITYGGLYQWDEMMQYLTTEGVQGICPIGWHLPTDAEWTILTDFLGGESIAGGKMKSTNGWYDNGNGTNSSGFTAIPGGNRDYNGYFSFLLKDAYIWSSSQGGATDAWSRFLYYNTNQVSQSGYYKTNGFSVRCIKN